MLCGDHEPLLYEACFHLELVVQLNHTPGFVVIVMVTQGMLALSSLKINAGQRVRHMHCLLICANVSVVALCTFSCFLSFDCLVVSVLC